MKRKVRITGLPKAQAGGDAPLTGQQMRNWNNVINFARSKKIDPSVLDHDPNVGYGIIDEYNKNNPDSSFDRNRVKDIQQMMLNYRGDMINKMKAVPENTLKLAGDPYKQFGPDYSGYMPNLSKADNFPGSKTLNWQIPVEYMPNDERKFEGPKKGFAPVTQGTIVSRRFGGNTGDQRGYALHVNYNIPSEPAPDDKLRSFIPAVPRHEANIEAERGESVLGDFNNDGKLEHMKIGGRRHSKGGTPLNVPGDSFIFSDTPKMKIGGDVLEHFGKPKNTKKKYTPADLAKQYDLNFYREKMDAFEKNGDTDKFSKDTAELMLDNNQKKLAKLAFVQESMKGFPSGVPGVVPELMSDAGDSDQMRFGGVPKFAWGGDDIYPPDKYGKHIGDNFASIDPLTGLKSNTWNAMTEYNGTADYAKKVGYTGKIDLSSPSAIYNTNKAVQQYVMDNYPSVVNKYHAKDSYGMPNAGTPIDGNLGKRWQSIADEINPVVKLSVPKNPNLSLVPGLNTTSPVNGPKNPFIPEQSTSNPPSETDNGFGANTPNFSNGTSRNVPMNFWDTKSIIDAATRPIDHIRPQLLRMDPMITPPSFVDNTAEIQQIQSMGNTANQVIQNTANGPVARANAMDTAGKLLDPINNSNMRTNQTNVGIKNQFNAEHDQVMNNSNNMNLNLLGRFIDQNNMYKANLSKEKQMKKADTTMAGQNATNNMITLGSILQNSPNYTVKGPFWNGSVFVPSSGDVLGNPRQGTDDNVDDEATIKKIMAKNNISWDQAINLLKLRDSRSSTKTTYKGLSNTPYRRTVSEN